MPSMLVLLLMATLFLGGLLILVLGVARQRRTVSLDQRLAALTEQPRTLEELELELPFRERVLQPMLHSLFNLFGKLSPSKNAGKIKQNLEQAGNPGNLTPTMFVGVRMTVGLLGAGIGFYFGTLLGLPLINRLLCVALGAVMGYILPGIWLDRKMRERKKKIFRSMPDALDLLSISVEAGLGFDLALQRVANKWDNDLSREFRRVISDMQLGIPRREALKLMADRCGVEELNNFVQAIVQAEQLGVSIGKILKVQSEQMRIRRRQRAEELAHQAPVKMLFPMVFLIFPSLLVVILGPAIPRLLSATALGG